jgi:hypothetical protein
MASRDETSRKTTPAQARDKRNLGLSEEAVADDARIESIPTRQQHHLLDTNYQRGIERIDTGEHATESSLRDRSQ